MCCVQIWQKIPKGSVSSFQFKIPKPDAIRWFKCKLKPSKNWQKQNLAKEWLLFLKKFWRTQVLFVGPLIPLFWTFGDVYPGFQIQGDLSLACFLTCVQQCGCFRGGAHSGRMWETNTKQIFFHVFFQFHQFWSIDVLKMVLEWSENCFVNKNVKILCVGVLRSLQKPFQNGSTVQN